MQEVMTFGTVLWMTSAAFLTICIFSFLYRDNPLYRFAEHLVVGVSAGYWIAILYHTSLTDLWIEPLGASIGAFGLPGGSFGAKFGALVLNIMPGLIGLLMFSRFFAKTSWISRWPIAFYLGISAGVALPLFLQSFVVRQVAANMVNPADIFGKMTADLTILFGYGNSTLLFWQGFGELIIIVGCICGLAYFYFSAEHRGIMGGAAKMGIWVLMIGFGATFGYTVMSRISLLIGRFNYLISWVSAVGDFLRI
jgi:hypothetical protein